MADRLHCAQPGCDAYMEFGGASRSMAATHRDEREMLETMAELTGWQRTFGDGFLCPKHRA